MAAIVFTMKAVGAETSFKAENGRFGSYEEILPRLRASLSEERIDYALRNYDFRLESDDGSYRMYAVQRKGSMARRSFFVDETGVVRESWGPEPASASSPVVK